MACKDWKEGFDLFSYTDNSPFSYGTWSVRDKTMKFCPFCSSELDSGGCTYLSNEEIIESLECIVEDYGLAEDEKDIIKIVSERLREYGQNKDMEVL